MSDLELMKIIYYGWDETHAPPVGSPVHSRYLELKRTAPTQEQVRQLISAHDDSPHPPQAEVPAATRPPSQAEVAAAASLAYGRPGPGVRPQPTLPPLQPRLTPLPPQPRHQDHATGPQHGHRP
ncbi:hypothetical protein ABT336_01135 [Micromonospora sp. NPDC000207]|uniref:hypothetical protein n=1 Tax=Micromonospora sp. NPDC000207 TaxID=3154246 RepID=UPI0033166403